MEMYAPMIAMKPVSSHACNYYMIRICRVANGVIDRARQIRRMKSMFSDFRAEFGGA